MKNDRVQDFRPLFRDIGLVLIGSGVILLLNGSDNFLLFNFSLFSYRFGSVLLIIGVTTVYVTSPTEKRSTPSEIELNSGISIALMLLAWLQLPNLILFFTFLAASLFVFGMEQRITVKVRRE